MKRVKMLVVGTLLIAGFVATPQAPAASSNLHCRPSAFDRKWSAYKIVTDRSMGCRLADAWAGAWQAWNLDDAHDASGAAIDDPAGNPHVVSFDYHFKYIGSFYTHYRFFSLAGHGILRVQAHGTNRMFVSFETGETGAPD